MDTKSRVDLKNRVISKEFFVVVYIELAGLKLKNGEKFWHIRKLYLNQKADFAQHITTCHPRFSDLPNARGGFIFSSLS